MQENREKFIHRLKTLEVKPSDLQLLKDYFSIIHHTKGRIRLRASARLKNATQDKGVNPRLLLEVLEQIPMIYSVKWNLLVGSLTICYDAKVLNPKIWEDCIRGESLEEIAGIINKSLKEIV